MWQHEWKLAEMLGLFEGEAMEWGIYIVALKVSHVRIKDEEDELLWSKNLVSDIYTPKLAMMF